MCWAQEHIRLKQADPKPAQSLIGFNPKWIQSQTKLTQSRPQVDPLVSSKSMTRLD